jgi:hypothetical protein
MATPLTPAQIAAIVNTPVETTTSTLPDAIPGGGSATAAASQPATSIRNISQTAQEREIIKTAPDLIVYLDGLPYIVNYFISDADTKNPFTVVGINDYVTSFNAGYDTENLIPSASIQLQVPNYVKHLFQMPGGNNLIATMMQVQVFAKGYYFGNDGSTLMRRVFKGVVSHISYADDGKMLQIQLQCNGILHLLEMMQLELAPGVVSNAPFESVPYNTNLASCNPYFMLQQMFLRSITTEGFYVNSLEGGGIVSDPDNTNNQYYDAVKNGYVAKWQNILNGIKNDVHFYGPIYKDGDAGRALGTTSPVKGTEDLSSKADINNIVPANNEAAQVGDFASVTKDGETFPSIRQYLPDMSVSSIQLLNGKIVNRMDQLRQIIRMILYEGYQDVDGKIIFKPPLYNLDVTMIGTETDTTSGQNSTTAGTTPPTSGTSTVNPSNSVTEINSTNNPFIIYLSEIISEQETEDEAAIRTTRMTVRGNWCTSFQVNGAVYLLDTVDYIDIPKMQKFGLREVPTVPVGWFSDGDKYGLWAFAASETVRSNRGYRMYSCTIPMRPELKLGFPVFLPHKDIYGYIKSIQLQYNQGGQATMFLTLDAIRRRFLLPTNSTDSNGNPKQVFVSQPDLVLQWTTAPNQPSTPTSPATPTTPTTTSATTTNQTTLSPSSANSGPVQQSTDTPATLVGQSATLPTTTDQALTPEQLAIINNAQVTISNRWTTESDNPGASWRYQLDTYGKYIMPPAGAAPDAQGTYGAAGGGGVFKGGYNPITGVFASPRHVDSGYYHDIRRTMPFTDYKGYEVISPFPWGRYISLRQAFKEFTQEGYIVPTPNPTPDSYTPPDQVQALLAAGLVTPTGAGANGVTALQTQMNTQSQVAPDYTIIVLKYTGMNTVSDSQLMTTAQPDVNSAIQQLQNTVTTQQQAIDVLVSGSISPTKATTEALAITQTQTTPGSTAATASPQKGLPQFGN